MQSDEFISAATLNGKRYRVTRLLRGQRGQRMCLVGDITDGEKTYLASIVHNPKGIPLAELRSKLAYRAPGTLELCDFWKFDPSPDEEADGYLEQRWVMLERIPPDSSWLPDLTTKPLGATRAVKLALSIGDLLQRCAEQGVLHSYIRPDYIWATLDGSQPLAVGVTTRPPELFAHMHRHSVSFIFTHHYTPLDAGRDSEGLATLTFPLASMIAEWSLGRWPFVSSWYGNPSPDIADRVHPELEVSLPLQRILHRGLTKDVAQRLPLPEFLDELRALTPEQLEA